MKPVTPRPPAPKMADAPDSPATQYLRREGIVESRGQRKTRHGYYVRNLERLTVKHELDDHVNHDLFIGPCWYRTTVAGTLTVTYFTEGDRVGTIVYAPGYWIRFTIFQPEPETKN